MAGTHGPLTGQRAIFNAAAAAPNVVWNTVAEKGRLNLAVAGFEPANPGKDGGFAVHSGYQFRHTAVRPGPDSLRVQAILLTIAGLVKSICRLYNVAWLHEQYNEQEWIEVT